MQGEKPSQTYFTSSPSDSAFLVKAEQRVLTSELPGITTQGTSHLLRLTRLLLNCVDLV